MFVYKNKRKREGTRRIGGGESAYGSDTIKLAWYAGKWADEKMVRPTVPSGTGKMREMCETEILEGL